MRTSSLTALLLATALSVSACGGKQAESPREAWSQLRDDAASSEDADVVADWLLSELIKPGGSPKQAKKARKRLDSIKAKTMLAELGRATDDVGHGRIADAASAYLRTIGAARTSDDPRANLVAWYAASFALELADQIPNFGQRYGALIDELLRDPGNIGFRSYAPVVDLWAKEELRNARLDVEAEVAKKLGCVKQVRIAGPFGNRHASDHLRSFSAEEPGPWPYAFPQEDQAARPIQVETRRYGCDVEASEAQFPGIFYGESYIELDQSEELIVTASGATKIWVDDYLVLERDVREWGVWPRFGAKLRLGAGRHRVMWKMGEPSTALRLLRSDGRPFPLHEASDETSGGYVLAKPEVLEDPNVIMKYITPRGVKDPEDDLTRFLVAFLANHEGQPDVATVMLEPLVRDPGEATGVTLAMAASFVAGDPIYDEGQTRELIHELEVRAAEHDPGLWYPRLRVALWDAEQRGLTEAVERLEQLVREFPEVTTLYNTLARTYEELGWGPELERTVRLVTKKFPDDPGAISLGIELAEEQGKVELADRLLAKLREEDPDSEVFLTRALARKDYEGALAELRRLATRRPSRKDLLARIEDVIVRSGDTSHVFAQLQEAIEREPRDVHSRLALADFERSRGKSGALARELVRAVEAGADPSLIEDAIDLIEGVTALDPYRIDALEVIAAYEEAGKEHPGTAVRVLDYGAVLVRSDGSSRFLEHELVRVQSEEGIKKFTELDTRGRTLHLRVIKQDGRILEPELVPGKPTVTMPHLEIGDYVEQERILSRWGDGLGETYVGPTWFFREQNIAYARSEFAIISPRQKELQIETENGVPAPVIEQRGSLVIHRYRVDDSPAAPVEPNSPPMSEFMPRLSVGWGLSFDERLRDTNRSLISLTPTDPRLRQIAEKIAEGHEGQLARARALYHWVLDSVQEGEETDGRRVVVSRTGNRWRAFVTLCESLDIPVRWALAESTLSSPLVGEVSSAQRPLMPLLYLGEGKDAVWLAISDRYAPFGTVPGPLRGEPAYVMSGPEVLKKTVPHGGQDDSISYEGTGVLAADGSARLSLRIIFKGQFAANLRNGLSQIAENQLAGIIESRLLGQELKGAKLLSHKVLMRDQLDRPLTIAVEVDAPQLATAAGDNELLLGPPFMPRLGGLTPLSQRVTPLLITDSTGQGLDLKLKLPAGMVASTRRSHAKNPRSSYEVQDQSAVGELHLVRNLRTDAGRVLPKDYLEFQSYARSADAALAGAIRIQKSSSSSVQ